MKLVMRIDEQMYLTIYLSRMKRKNQWKLNMKNDMGQLYNPQDPELRKLISFSQISIHI